MELLQNGVDQSVIALWLGHDSVETTQVYIHADLRLKEQRWLAWQRQHHCQVALPLPTSCSRSRKGSDYAEPPRSLSTHHHGTRMATRHNPDRGIVADLMEGGPVPIDRFE